MRMFFLALVVLGVLEIIGSRNNGFLQFWYKIGLLKYTKVDLAYLKIDILCCGIGSVILGIIGLVVTSR